MQDLDARKRLALLSGPLAVFVSLVSLVGCGPFVDSSVEQFVLRPVAQFGPRAHWDDLDFDGSDEVVYFAGHSISHELWLISDASGRVIEQLNLPGRVLGPISFGEIDGESGSREVLLPVNRNDSLFAYVYRSDGSFFGAPLFITSGQSRLDPGGLLIPWEADCVFRLVDIDGDNEDELISIVNTAYARSGRGLYVHELDGTPRDRYLVGAPLEAPRLEKDIDGDGILELVFQTSTPDNGASANGYKDDISYILSFEMSLPLEPDFRVSSTVPHANLHVHEGAFGFTPDGSKSLLIAEVQGRTTARTASRVSVYIQGMPLSSQTPKTFEIRSSVGTAVVDLDDDGSDDFVLATSSGELLRVDVSTGGVLQAELYDQPLKHLFPCGAAFVRGDAKLCARGLNKTYFLDGSLSVTHISEWMFRPATIRAGERALMLGGNNLGIEVDEMPKLPFFLRRYRFLIALLLVSLAILVVAWFGQAAIANSGRKLLLEQSLAFVTGRPAFLSRQHTSGPQRLVGIDELRNALESGFRDSEFGVQQFAAAVFRSERQLLRDCRRMTGTSPRAILVARRLNEAARLLLAEPGINMNETAERSGFKSAARMATEFSEAFGASPEEFRAQYGNRGYVISGNNL